ncbi:MAG TPA: hypothetical protein VFY87_19470 [Geminicoccaceae bacterium]|nr:hypothetical protein [Geminicoccaceae bacterium]
METGTVYGITYYVDGPKAAGQDEGQSEEDWGIVDVQALCGAFGIECAPPKRERHYKVWHACIDEILTIPADWPIKPFYIRKLVVFVEHVVGEDAT